MEFDALTLARLQFAFTVSFHIIFPAFTIGIASYLAVLEGLWLYTGRSVFLALFNYWKKIFAISFGMGVVSGIVMSYQFGTNWSVFSDKTGPILGPLMAYEVMAAFFLEAGFLGVMLFGMERVGKRLHFFATLMVAAGTLMSAFWILSANSWMHTPAGFAVNAAGQFVATDWWAVIFNPSFPYRLVHMVLAAYLTTAFVVGAVGAFHLLGDRANEGARVMFSMAMWMAAVVAPLQVVAGDLHGLNTLEHQPAKIAAMEGHWETGAGQPLILFGWPDMEAETTRYAVEIPKLGSFILTHDWNGTVKGLKAWPRSDRPNSTIVFWSFRIMVGLGTLMVAIGIWSLWLRFRRRLFASAPLLRASVLMGPSGFVAVLAGWITTESGRQPFTVYGLLRTAEFASPIDVAAVGASLVAFIIVYFLVFGAGTFYLLRLMRKPPDLAEPDIEKGIPTRAAGITPAPALGGGGAAMFELSFIWAGLIAFAVLAYVLFDGFDLGIGILFPFLADDHERDVAMNSVAPVWDGNETWLILGGGGLMAAFPLAYAVVMPALYAPITAMLLGLIFRGVAFEFRWRTERGKFLWDWSFALGSLIAAIAQGIALGALIQGIPVSGRAYAGGWWNWLTWFSLLTGFALAVGYALLGATWLILKTSGELQEQARRFAWITGLGTLALIGLVSLITPFLDPIFMQRWFAWPAIIYVAPVPIFVALAALALLWGLYRRREAMPFVAAMALFVLSYIGLGISFYPYIVPPSLTIADAAAPDNSLKFLLVGASMLIPLILAYTTWSYWVFRGKVDPKASYH